LQDIELTASRPLCNPIASAPGSARPKKMQCSKPSLSLDLHQASGTYMEQLDFTGWKREMVFRALLFMLSRGAKPTL
jgi:hypothetical protein